LVEGISSPPPADVAAPQSYSARESAAPSRGEPPARPPQRRSPEDDDSTPSASAPWSDEPFEPMPDDWPDDDAR
jgi:hypothetical protein